MFEEEFLMADLDKKQNGASPVEQSKDADDILDSPYDDIPEVKDKSLKEIKEKDLDRGQELYTGFGFGGVDASGVDVEDIADSNPVPRVSEGNKDEHVFIAGSGKKAPANENVPIKTITKEENTIFETARDDEQNIAPVRENVNNKVESYREVPEDTKVVIKPDNGDVVYRETTIDRPIGRTSVLTDKRVVDTKNTGLTYNKESAIDVPADYQLAGVYYGNDYRDNRNYLIGPYQTDAYSIKKHYKNQARDRKGGLPIKKIALGVAAVAGVLWLIKDDDDGFFG